MYKDERWVQQERNKLISLLQDAQNNQKEKMSTEQKGAPFKSHVTSEVLQLRNNPTRKDSTAITGPTQFNKAHSLLGRKSITTSFRCFSFFFFLKSLVLIRPFRWRHSRVISPTKGSDLYLSAFYFSTLEFICGKQN